MPFDEFSLIIDDYLEILEARKKQNEENESERRRMEAEQKSASQKFK